MGNHVAAKTRDEDSADKATVTPTVNSKALDASWEDNDYPNTPRECGVFDQYARPALAVLDYENKRLSRADGLDIDFYRFTVYPWQGENKNGVVAIRLTNPIDEFANPDDMYDLYLFREVVAGVGYTQLSNTRTNTDPATRTLFTPASTTVQTYVIGVVDRDQSSDIPTDPKGAYALTMTHQ